MLGFSHIHILLSKYHTSRLPLTVNFFSTQGVYACNVKIAALSRAGNIQSARRLFDEMPSRDIVSWNAIITGYWKNGHLDESRKLFESMGERNIISWNSMIAGCIENERLDEAQHYFHSMPGRNTASYNAMISGLIKHDRLDEAGVIFKEMPQRNVISYTAMIDGYTRKGEIEKARTLFDQIPFKNSVSWTVMISGYVENGLFNEAKELFECMPNKNVVAVTAMITGYCKEGEMEIARSLFEEIGEKDTVCWNSLITGYGQNGNDEEALNLHSQMLKLGIPQDHSTLISVLTACSNLASLKQGRQTHSLVVKCGLESNTSICNGLITMYSRCGGIFDSETIFKQMDGPDLVSWNTIIAAFAQHGLYDKALSLFKQMENNGFDPDGITFLSVLSSCGHSGKINESLTLFNSMSNRYGIVPRPEHYACLIDILSRAGKLEEAYNLIKKMPFEADSAIWGSLLSACRVYLHVELGELAAKKILELTSENSGPYVMLSNIYAAMGNWGEVMRVRGLMKGVGVKKQPAYSWMEIGNEVHFFLGGDVSHPEIDKIHLELKKIRLQMKVADEIVENDSMSFIG